MALGVDLPGTHNANRLEAAIPLAIEVAARAAFAVNLHFDVGSAMVGLVSLGAFAGIASPGDIDDRD